MSLRVLISGAGATVFPSHLRGLRAIGAEVVAVQNPNLARTTRAAQELGCPAFAGLEEMLTASAAAADVAVVLAPHRHHAAITIACLRAGLHVLVEKPLAVSVYEADRMINEAERAGRILAVAFQRRGLPEVKAARRLLEAGALGRIVRVDLLASWPRRTSYYATGAWRGTWAGEGGGVLLNQGQHDLDLLCLLAGTPVQAVGWTSNRMHRTETEDTALGLVEWSGGATGSIRISTAELDEARRIEISGTAGRLRLMPGGLEAWHNQVDFETYAAAEGDPYQSPGWEPVPAALEGAGGDHVDLYRNLAQALAGRAAPLASGADSLAALELSNAITLSGATGRPVRLPVDRREYGRFLDERSLSRELN